MSRFRVLNRGLAEFVQQLIAMLHEEIEAVAARGLTERLPMLPVPVRLPHCHLIAPRISVCHFADARRDSNAIASRY
jgi:hypothetical protein